MTQVNKVRTDVMVIGAGLAGIMAAIEASDSGSEVFLISKGPFGSDGAATWMAGWGFQAALYSPDSPEIHAADMIKIAMINIQRRIEEEGLSSKMILQVHDELVFDVLKSELEQMQTLVQYEMEHAIELNVPIKVEMGTGTNWLGAH